MLGCKLTWHKHGAGYGNEGDVLVRAKKPASARGHEYGILDDTHYEAAMLHACYRDGDSQIVMFPVQNATSEVVLLRAQKGTTSRRA